MGLSWNGTLMCCLFYALAVRRTWDKLVIWYARRGQGSEMTRLEGYSTAYVEMMRFDGALTSFTKKSVRKTWSCVVGVFEG